MNAKTLCVAALFVMTVVQPLTAQRAKSPLPDLRIRKFLSPPGAPQKLRVLVANAGRLGSAECLLRLTVIKINGAAVRRTTEIRVPPLAAGKTEWLLIDASSILPKAVALKDTAFSLDVDSDDMVDETDERNNHLSYRPQARAS